jgi:hypothetical protein
LGCKTEAGMTGMAFNSDLSGKKMAEVKDPYGTIVIFEIEKATRNAHGTFKARSKENSPKIMGERRGWIEMPLQGSARGFDMGRRSGKIEIKIDDNSSDEKKKSEDPAPSPEGV